MDDANQTQVDNFSQMNAVGVPITFFLIGNKVSVNAPTWKQAAKAGHELGNHTQSHGHSVGGQADVTDLSNGQSSIQTAAGVTTVTSAGPYGDTGWGTAAANLYFLNRALGDTLMMPNSDSNALNTNCWVPPQGETAAASGGFNSHVDSARTGGGWGVVVVHGFTGGTDGAYQPVNASEWVSALTYAKNLGDVWVDTYENVGAYWRGGIAVGKATNSGTTYMWTLPAHFPPNKFVRVTVTGGTVSQNGTVIPWDTHGYYEISLDAGQVTIGP
jgi:hypothetical protein